MYILELLRMNTLQSSFSQTNSKKMKTLILFVFLLGATTLNARHVHFSNGGIPGMGSPFFIASGVEQPPQVFLSGQGSSSTYYNQGEIEPGTELSFSVTCTETQHISRLWANIAVQLNNDPSADVIIETRIRKAAATDLQAASTDVFATFLVGYDSGNLQMLQAVQQGSESFVCERGHRLILETRVSCPEGEGVVSGQLWVSVSLTATEETTIALASGTVAPFQLAANAESISGFVTGFGHSSEPLFNVSNLGPLTETQYAWVAPRNASVDRLHIRGLLQTASSETENFHVDLILRKQSRVVGFVDSLVVASTDFALSSSAQVLFAAADTQNSLNVEEGDQIVLQTRLSCISCADTLEVEVGLSGSLRLWG